MILPSGWNQGRLHMEIAAFDCWRAACISLIRAKIVPVTPALSGANLKSAGGLTPS